VGDKITLWGAPGGNNFGLGIQAGTLQLFCGDNTNIIAFGYGRSGAFTEGMRLQNGNLTVNGTLNVSNITGGGQYFMTSDYTWNPSVKYIILNGGGGTWTLTVPSSGVVSGTDFYIYSLQGISFNITAPAGTAFTNHSTTYGSGQTFTVSGVWCWHILATTILGGGNIAYFVIGQV
jgi:hypothetical protein